MLDAFGRPQSVVVLGGTSDIAGALLAHLGPTCEVVVLAGRQRDRLASASVVDRCFDSAGGEGVDLVVVAVGDLGVPGRRPDPARIADVVCATFAWPAVALGRVADRMTGQGAGRIVVLSSVAAVRVRPSNFTYGAAKRGLDAFALGLAEDLEGSGVELHVIRPGFVRTKMTEGLPAAPLAVSPDAVVRSVVRAIERRQLVTWCPAVLRWAFLVFVHLPRPLWQRLAARAG
jgi:decaprenylphospho-beta-D-erythro-pentofuranosid-2-ulose 2-reductase